MALQTTIIGYPRVGAHRELKKVTERYFMGLASSDELQAEAKRLRSEHWKKQQQAGISLLPVGDFSFYDGTLDTAVLLGIVPERYRQLGLSSLDTYFAMAHGYQGDKGDVTALAMKKWFNTNYHYLVPEIDDSAVVSLNASKLLDELAEAKSLSLRVKAVVQGPFTFLKLARFTGSKSISDFESSVADAYADLLSALQSAGVEWLQIDEPYLVRDLDAADIQLLQRLYSRLAARKGNVKLLLQTYFGDIRDVYNEVVALPVDGVGLDFIEGVQTLDLVRKNSFPASKTLFAGVVNGKNITTNSSMNMTKEDMKEMIIKQVEQSAPDQAEMVKKNIDQLMDSGMLKIEMKEKATYELADDGWVKTLKVENTTESMGQSSTTTSVVTLK